MIVIHTAVIFLGILGAAIYGFALSSFLAIWLNLVSAQTGRRREEHSRTLSASNLWAILICGILCVLVSSAAQTYLHIAAERTYWLTYPTIFGFIYAQMQAKKDSSGQR